MTTFWGVVSNPTPPYTNPPIEPQFYAPSRFQISSISQGQNTTITTTTNHNYVIGQLVRITLPYAYGMYQINEGEGVVISIPAPNEVIITVNSSTFDAYIAATNKNVPQIMAIGDYNYGIISLNGTLVGSTNVPGSFINIS